MTGSNGNNVKDWVIRRREAKPAVIGYASVSTIAKRWVGNDSLINLILLKVRSRPLGKPWGFPFRKRTGKLKYNYSMIMLLLAMLEAYPLPDSGTNFQTSLTVTSCTLSC